jgi:hypothetical protein
LFPGILKLRQDPLVDLFQFLLRYFSKLRIQDPVRTYSRYYQGSSQDNEKGFYLELFKGSFRNINLNHSDRFDSGFYIFRIQTFFLCTNILGVYQDSLLILLKTLAKITKQNSSRFVKFQSGYVPDPNTRILLRVM